MKIACFPKDSHNPYQEMLYQPIRAAGVPVAYISSPTKSATLNLATYIPQLIVLRLRGYTVLHLHWAIPFAPSSLPWRNALGKKVLYAHYRLFLSLTKLLGYKLVWTAHNALPLMGAFSDDVAARRYLARKADLVIAHSQQTLERLQGLTIVPKQSIVIPHGSYVGVYPNSATRAEARARLRIPEGAFVYLFLGNIEFYKGITKLLKTYPRVRTEHTVLLLAGESTSPDLERMVMKSSERGDARWMRGRVKDDDLQYFYAAADVAVLPFTSITTSGSTLLALSFGRSVIVPRMGDVAHLPDACSYKYDPNDAEGLGAAMEAAYHDAGLPDKNAAALAYAQTLSWPEIAAQTLTAIQQLR